jgi:hypothetical protein
MSCQRTGRNENSSKFEGKMIEKENSQLVTSCIVHLADSANFKDITFNKLYSGLTGWCFVNAKRHHTRDR